VGEANCMIRDNSGSEAWLVCGISFAFAWYSIFHSRKRLSKELTMEDIVMCLGIIY